MCVPLPFSKHKMSRGYITVKLFVISKDVHIYVYAWYGLPMSFPLAVSGQFSPIWASTQSYNIFHQTRLYCFNLVPIHQGTLVATLHIRTWQNMLWALMSCGRVRGWTAPGYCHRVFFCYFFHLCGKTCKSLCSYCLLYSRNEMSLCFSPPPTPPFSFF